MSVLQKDEQPAWASQWLWALQRVELPPRWERELPSWKMIQTYSRTI